MFEKLIIYLLNILSSVFTFPLQPHYFYCLSINYFNWILFDFQIHHSKVLEVRTTFDNFTFSKHNMIMSPQHQINALDTISQPTIIMIPHMCNSYNHLTTLLPKYFHLLSSYIYIIYILYFVLRDV